MLVQERYRDGVGGSGKMQLGGVTEVHWAVGGVKKRVMKGW